jgi:hypothetical protein
MRKSLWKKIAAIVLSLAIVIPLKASAEGNPYPGGWDNCTWSAWQLVSDTDGIQLPSWGNAGEWLSSAAASGYPVGSEPMPNSIVVFSHHVAVVDAVDQDGNIYIREGGYQGRYNEGWESPYSTSGGALLGYIYLGEAGSSTYVVPDSTDTAASAAPTAAPTATPDPNADKAISEDAETALEQEKSTVKMEDSLTDTAKSDEKSALEETKTEIIQGKVLN